MDTVAVPGVACPCPGEVMPHPEGDVVSLRARPTMAGGAELQAIIAQANARKAGNAEVIGLLAEGYLLVGVCEWTFVDERGKPVPVTRDTIRTMLLDDFQRAMPIAERANDLYEGPVLGPLVNGAATSSRTTTTGSSTSRKGSGSPKSRRQPKRSSTSTTRTAVTGTTS